MSSVFQAAYVKGFESRWQKLGCVWAKHIPQDNGPHEWLRVIFQDMPENSDVGGMALELSDTMPTIWVLQQEVVQPLWQFRAENRHAEECGSCISVCGQHYQVESTMPNHRGGIKVMLKHKGCCSEYDPDFDDEINGILCDEDICIDVSEPEKPNPPVYCRCPPRCGCPVCKGLRKVPAGYQRKMPWRLPVR